MSRRRLARPALAAALALALAGCATFGGGAGAAAPSTSDVQDQLFKLQKDNATVIDRLDQIEKNLGKEDRGACAEVGARTEVIERQLRVLEEQILATQKRIDDVLAELRSSRRVGVVAVPAPAAGASAGAAPAAGPADAPTAAQGLPGTTPEDSFNSAYADYSRGAYDLALAGFDNTLRSDPQGPLADDAQFWIGETLYARGQYLEAAAAFDKVATGWPKGDKLALARLKKGFALYEGKRTAEGVLELQRVIQAWPGSDEARLARNFLQRKGVLD